METSGQRSSMSAMQMALEALESKYIVNCGAWRVQQDQAITALRQALVDADDTSQERVDEIVKTEHNKQIEIAKAYERGWNAALAQQEPVAWMHTTGTGHVYFRKKPQDKVFNPQPVFTAPPKREWVGLTLNEAEDFYDKYTDRAELINAIDKFLAEKNHG